MLVEYIKKTQKPYEVVITEVVERFSQRNFGLLCKIDLNENYKNKGIDFDTKFTILEVCNAFHSYDAITINEKALYFLPCKLIVTEEEGFGVIKMIRPTGLIGILEDPNLIEFASRIEVEIIDTVDSI